MYIESLRTGDPYSATCRETRTLVYVEKLFSTRALCISTDSGLRRKPVFYVCKHIAAAYMRFSIFIQPAEILLVKGNADLI